MKIRMDFVTNSSSSNFIVQVTISTKDNKSIVLCEDPFEYNPDEGGEAYFNGDLTQINKHLSSVEELATWLADSVSTDNWDGRERNSLKRKKKEFISDAKSLIKNVKDIERITVEREYYAWGEFAELVADNSKLIKFAEKYLESEGIEKERAKAEMITYINTATDARGYSFGRSSVISRYRWDGNSIDELAKRLCSNQGPVYVSGSEYKSLNLTTGEYFDESEFDLR